MPPPQQPQEVIDALGATPLVGRGPRAALGRLAEHLADPGGAARLVIVKGPPVSGKSRVCADALAACDYDVKRFRVGASPAEVQGEARDFLAASNSIQYLMSRRAKKKAVLVDCTSADAAHLKRLYALVSGPGGCAVMIACLPRTQGVRGLDRKASLVLDVPYPEPEETAAFLASRFPAMDPARALRAAEAAQGCVQIALLALEAGAMGQAIADVFYDETLVQKTARCVERAWSSGSTYAESEDAVSSEPMLATLMLANDAYRYVDDPGDYLAFLDSCRDASRFAGAQPAQMTRLFCAAAMATAPRGRGARARAYAPRFPRCYTMHSARQAAVNRRQGGAAPAARRE